CSVKAGRGTRMTFLAGGRSVFKVTNVLRILDQSFFGPASGTLRPVVYVGGPVASFGSYDQAIPHAIPPNANVGVGLGATSDGAICGHDLKGAWRDACSCTDTGRPRREEAAGRSPGTPLCRALPGSGRPSARPNAEWTVGRCPPAGTGVNIVPSL